MNIDELNSIREGEDLELTIESPFEEDDWEFTLIVLREGAKTKIGGTIEDDVVTFALSRDDTDGVHSDYADLEIYAERGAYTSVTQDEEGNEISVDHPHTQRRVIAERRVQLIRSLRNVVNTVQTTEERVLAYIDEMLDERGADPSLSFSIEGESFSFDSREDLMRHRARLVRTVRHQRQLLRARHESGRYSLNYD